MTLDDFVNQLESEASTAKWGWYLDYDDQAQIRATSPQAEKYCPVSFLVRDLGVDSKAAYGDPTSYAKRFLGLSLEDSYRVYATADARFYLKADEDGKSVYDPDSNGNEFYDPELRRRLVAAVGLIEHPEVLAMGAG